MRFLWEFFASIERKFRNIIGCFSSFQLAGKAKKAERIERDRVLVLAVGISDPMNSQILMNLKSKLTFILFISIISGLR